MSASLAFSPLAPPARPTGLSRSGGASRGALLVPDFDAPVTRVTALAAPDPAEEAAAAVAAACAAARAEGRAEGEAEGRAAAAALHAAERATLEAEALSTIAAALANAERAAQRAATEAAEGLGRLLLAALDAALPAAAARLAPETAAALVAEIRPVLEREAHGVRLLVAPGLGAACAARVTDRRVEVEEDAAVAPGDARAEWRGGSAAALLDRRRETVAEVLTALRLVEA
jgi:hypothetical protein